MLISAHNPTIIRIELVGIYCRTDETLPAVAIACIRGEAGAIKIVQVIAGGMSTTTVEKTPVGQLTVDIGDAKTKKLAWMANASDTLSDNPEKKTKKTNNAVEKMLRNFLRHQRRSRS